VRLHFAEIFFTQAGQRVFNVSINGQSALANFDIVAAAGAPNKAVVESFLAVADANGNIAVTFASVTGGAKLSGLEVAAPPLDTTTTLSASSSSAKLGDSVTFTATIGASDTSAGVPTGTVQFQVDGADIGTPVAVVQGVVTSAPITSLSIGQH